VIKRAHTIATRRIDQYELRATAIAYSATVISLPTYHSSVLVTIWAKLKKSVMDKLLNIHYATTKVVLRIPKNAQRDLVNLVMQNQAIKVRLQSVKVQVKVDQVLTDRVSDGMEVEITRLMHIDEVTKRGAQTN